MTVGRCGLASQHVIRDEELHDKLQSRNTKKNRTGIFEFRTTFYETVMFRSSLLLKGS